MTRCDLMIRGGDVLDPETPGSSLADHSVVIVDDHIVDIAPRSEAGERWRPRRTIDASGCVIAPGFVDAHLMHAALIAHREAGGTDDAIVLEDVVGMATNSGPVMGRPGELGTIRAGQLADLVVLDTSAPHHLGSRHPVPSLALRGRPSDIRTVIVNGAVVVDDGQVTTVDVDQARDHALATLRD